MEEEWMLQMREKMADYKWPAPELKWDELDLALAAGTTHKTHLLWPRRMAAAAVVLLIAGVGYWGLLRHNTEPIIEKHWAQKPPLQIISSQGDMNDMPSQTSHAFFDKRSGRAERLSPREIQEPEIVTPVSVAEIDTLNTTEPTEKEQPYILPVIYPSDLHQRKHLDNRLTTKVYMSSTMSGNLTESSHDIGSYSTVDDPYSPHQSDLAKQYAHHRQPVRFGLLLRYRLDDHWSIESGLSYTRLSSDIATTVNEVTTVTEQRLNYIGLPLNISYDLWKSRHFGLYVTAGGTIEKCLNASLWQFSLNGAAGAEYKLSNSFSLYAEPGLGYYFKDGSSTLTIYKDHPLNFNLSVGIRFNLK